MGLLSTYEDAEKAYDSKKTELKAVLSALADVAIKAADKEKMTAESLLLKAEVGNLKIN